MLDARKKVRFLILLVIFILINMLFVWLMWSEKPKDCHSQETISGNYNYTDGFRGGYYEKIGNQPIFCYKGPLGSNGPCIIYNIIKGYKNEPATALLASCKSLLGEYKVVVSLSFENKTLMSFDRLYISNDITKRIFHKNKSIAIPFSILFFIFTAIKFFKLIKVI